jgi:hypothetical protein
MANQYILDIEYKHIESGSLEFVIIWQPKTMRNKISNI